jgi:16S rRNA (adenine1518-N6/adenine1519-N6)-dimethyltransferase
VNAANSRKTLAAFQQRRKTLRNSLSSVVSMEQLKRVGIDPRLRAEQVSIAEFLKLAATLHEARRWQTVDGQNTN